MEIVDYNDKYFESVSLLLKDTFNYEKSRVSSPLSHEFVCLIDGAVVGYFILNEMIDVVRNIKIFHVDYVCVDSKFRGRGIGKKMMEYAVNYAKSNGGTRMELTSGNQREAAHRLYLGLGFVKRDTTVFRKDLI